jgi:hypothetical protein
VTPSLGRSLTHCDEEKEAREGNKVTYTFSFYYCIQRLSPRFPFQELVFRPNTGTSKSEQNRRFDRQSSRLEITLGKYISRRSFSGIIIMISSTATKSFIVFNTQNEKAMSHIYLKMPLLFVTANLLTIPDVIFET